MLLTEAEIESLLRQEPITDEWPWNTSDVVTVCENIRDILAEVWRKPELRIVDNRVFLLGLDELYREAINLAPSTSHSTSSYSTAS